MAKIPLKEIAKKAQVSISTTSRVLSNPHIVHLDTRLRVFKAMEELGYQVPVKGKPRGRGKGAVALVTPVIHSEFFLEFLTELQDGLTPLGLYPLVVDTRNQYDLGSFLEQDAGWTALVDGVICFFSTIDLRTHQYFLEKGLPLALIHSRCPYYFSVMNNDYLGGYDGAAFLWKRGYRNIGLVSFDPAKSDKFRDRVNGVKAFFQNQQTASMEQEPFSDTDIWIESMSMEGGFKAIERALEKKAYDALFFLTDTMAVGGMEYCRNRGISIPKELAILGYDDLHIAKALNISTMNQFIPDQARAVTNYLKTYFENPIPRNQAGEITLTPVVIPRSTT